MPDIKELHFDEVETGAAGTSPKVTMTSEMIMAYADLTGDHTPVHTDEEFARKGGWGILRLASELVNQRGEIVQTGVHKLMIPTKSTAAA